jgi:hypothetical protein
MPAFDASGLLEPLYQRIKEVAAWNAKNLMAEGRFLTLEEMDAVTASGIKRADIRIAWDRTKPKQAAISCSYAWFEKDELLLKLYKEAEKLLPKIPEKARREHNAAKVLTEEEFREKLEADALTLGLRLVPIGHES